MTLDLDGGGGHPKERSLQRLYIAGMQPFTHLLAERLKHSTTFSAGAATFQWLLNSMEGDLEHGAHDL